jgi:hypothetical protein
MVREKPVLVGAGALSEGTNVPLMSTTISLRGIRLVAPGGTPFPARANQELGHPVLGGLHFWRCILSVEENEAIEASVEMESMDYLSRGNGDEELWEYLPQQRRRGKGQNSGGDEYSKDGNSYLRGKMEYSVVAWNV